MPDVDLVPTEEMAEAATRGLMLRKKYNRGGTAVGVARARDIKNRTELSSETVKRMVAFFDRHEKNKAGGEDDAGYIAWLLWGGDPGRAWAVRKVKELERKQENGMTKSSMTFAKSPTEKARDLIAKARKLPNAPLGALDQAEMNIANPPNPSFVERLVADLERHIKENTPKAAPKPKAPTKPKASAAPKTPAAPKEPKQPKAPAPAPALPQRGIVGRIADRARGAVSALTTRTVDPTSPNYAQGLDTAKAAGAKAAQEYKAAAAAHNAALGRLDKYVDHAAKAIAGAQSARDIAHYLTAVQTATRTRSIGARSMPTPFSRPGSNKTMSSRPGAKAKFKWNEDTHAINNDLNLALSAIRSGNIDHAIRMIQQAQQRSFYLFSRPGAKVARPGTTAMAYKADDAVSRKIALLVREGYPQDQAAAIAYDMKRRGELS